MLVELGVLQEAGRDPLMAVRVIPGEPAWEALRDLGPYSHLTPRCTRPCLRRTLSLLTTTAGRFLPNLQGEFAQLIERAVAEGMSLDDIVENAGE